MIQTYKGVYANHSRIFSIWNDAVELLTALTGIVDDMEGSAQV